MIIGLAGKKGSGKDTIADYLCEQYGFIGNSPSMKKLDYAESWMAIEKYFVNNGIIITLYKIFLIIEEYKYSEILSDLLKVYNLKLLCKRRTNRAHGPGPRG